MIAVGLLGLSACDSREDWFDKNAPQPDLVVTIGDKVDTLTGSDSKVIEVNLHATEIDYLDMFKTDSVNFHIGGVKDTKNVPLEGLHAFMTEYGGTGNPFEKKGDGFWCLCYICGDNWSDYGLSSDKEIDVKIYAKAVLDFESDTSARVETCVTRFWVEDVFEGQYYYTLKINIIGDIPPTPVLKVRRLDYNYEYSLSLEESYDRDGKVSKYEWCIDGNTVPYDVKDPRYESKEGAWQSGQAAYGGKYVKATTISSINHNFQSPGEHKVYYRCMDNLGAWSMWYSQTINVEE